MPGLGREAPGPVWGLEALTTAAPWQTARRRRWESMLTGRVSTSTSGRRWGQEELQHLLSLPDREERPERLVHRELITAFHELHT